jgi:protein tyrosine phosphatase (PTP) superfamily phosphohydrolase (DUF442 family)
MRRVAWWLVVGWLGAYAVVNLGMLLLAAMARRTGKDRRAHGAGWPNIHNLRVVDDRLVIGAQPTPEHYRELASRGVTGVINLRTGGPADPVRDDPALLASLGVHHASVPIPDGHAPTAAQLRQILDRVAQADGPSYVHCGGGVGRAGSVAAAYLAAHGQKPSVHELLAVGPPSLEQLWFLATCKPGKPADGAPAMIALASRLIDAPRRPYGRLRRRR